MSIDKIKKITRILMIILTVLEYLFLFVSIGMLILSGIVWLAKSPNVIESLKPEFDNVVCQGTNLILDGKIFSIPMFSLGAFGLAVENISIAIALFFGRSICKCIYNGETPFQYVFGEKIRHISFFLLISFIIRCVIDGFENILSMFVILFIIFSVSFIFDYGCELQEEVDEIL